MATSNSWTLTTLSAAFSVAAQVKGPEVGFPVESLTGFRCTCDADRIDYW